MTLIAEEGGAQLYEYLPTALKFLAINFENPRLVRQISTSYILARISRLAILFRKGLI